jgi:hypothetical protein
VLKRCRSLLVLKQDRILRNIEAAGHYEADWSSTAMGEAQS